MTNNEVVDFAKAQFANLADVERHRMERAAALAYCESRISDNIAGDAAICAQPCEPCLRAARAALANPTPGQATRYQF